MPECSQAVLVTLLDCSPAWVTQPPTICSTSAGSMPARSTTACCTFARRWAGWNAESAPFEPCLPLPIGVRNASTMTASRMCGLLLPEDHGARGDADAGGHQHVVVLLR